jgi:hypothetical protein
MKSLVKARAAHRPRTFRPWLEQLEDRMTPSGPQGLDVGAWPIGVVPQPVSPDHLIRLASPLATQVSGTYVTGTTDSATAEGVAVGADGSTYVTGLVNDPALSTDQLAYVAKYDPTGAVVYYTTFFAFDGPGSSTEGTGIAVDDAGNAYVSGKAHNVADGTDDGVYLKLDPTGSTPVYFLKQRSSAGGPVGANGVAIDAAGDAVFTGSFVAFGHNNMYAARFDPSGTQVFNFIYAFGGTHPSSQANGAAMPASGTVTTIAGWANVTPDTIGPNATVLQVNATGAPISAIILTTRTTDSANAVALDAAGNVYLATTTDIGGPTQTGSTAKLQPNLIPFWWNVPVGPSSLTANGIALDDSGNLIVTGADSSGQAYLSQVSGTDGTTTDYTVFGGSGGADVGNAVAVRPGDGHVFVAGTTNSSDFAVTDGSTLNGTQDGFLTEWTIP